VGGAALLACRPFKAKCENFGLVLLAYININLSIGINQFIRPVGFVDPKASKREQCLLG
jgi:hypothetical protein